MSETALAVSTNSYLAPVVDVEGAVKRYEDFKQFVGRVLKEDHDFGKVPGTDKPTLLKAGAEKLGAFFGLRPIFALQESVNDWTGKDHGGEPFFFREYKVQLFKNGELVGEGVGSCNSWEKKYRYRWMPEMEVPSNVDKTNLEYTDGTISEFVFAVEKGETSGKYGKPAAYWKQFRDAVEAGTAREIMKKTKSGEMKAYEIGGKLYAVPNKNVADQVNTIDKMAQKRAFVAAILIATNASDYFTQDMEDFQIDNAATVVVDGSFKEEHKTDAPSDELLSYSNAAMVKVYADIKGLSISDAARGLHELHQAGKIPDKVTLDQIKNL